MNDVAYCRYCKDKQEMEIMSEGFYEDFENSDKVQYIYWCECPMCGSRSPVSETKEGALEYAVYGYN